MGPRGEGILLQICSNTHCFLSIVSFTATEIGKEYVYSYEANMKYEASSMPTRHPGMAFRSSVRVQKVDDKHYALKIEDMEVATLNDPEFDWSDKEKIAYEKNARLKEVVERPFVVEFGVREGGAGPQVGLKHS